jgi:hypothetical protein
MKKVFLLTLVCLFGFSVFAQDSFFPTKSGTVVAYKSFDKKGKVTSGSRITIKDVQGTRDNMSITYEVESLDAKDGLVFKDQVTIIQKGDVMYFDMGNFLNKSAFQKDGQIPAEVKITGNSMEIPMNAAAGTVLPDASVLMELKMGFINMKMSANVTNRKVEGWEDVTVKGGTFNCCKFSEDVTATTMGMNIKSKAVDWYAKGVGIVKSETYDKKGDLESTRELVELRK